MNDLALAHVVAALEPASADAAARARACLPGGGSDLDGIGELAVRLAGARHSALLALTRKHVVICAGDHGVAGLPRADSTTTAAMAEIASGRAPVNALARTAGAAVAIVDCGVRGGGAVSGVMELPIGQGTGDIRREPAMTAERAAASVDTGIALMLSLSDAGVDCLALGQLARGSEPSSAAIAVALTAMAAEEVAPGEQLVVRAALSRWSGDTGALAVLAALGGYETGVMAGLMVAAASLHVPVVLDDHGTSAAALVAARLAPEVSGYLVASHAGSSPGHKRALAALGLRPLFDLGVARGEGAGSALALPILESAAGLVREG
jgi:nicotinate-nucleotide--dimethylbenzimidazole phosphoribosyltransferase